MKLYTYDSQDAALRDGLAIYHTPDDIVATTEDEAARHAMIVTWVYPDGSVEQWKKTLAFGTLPDGEGFSTFENYCKHVADQIANRHTTCP